MSVLNFPRIYFNGHMSWNPPTGNNNDALPLYDAAKVEMNWAFLEKYGITPANADQQLHPWMISGLTRDNVAAEILAVPENARSFNEPYIPAEWNFFGDNGCAAVDYQNIHSTIIGGETTAGNYINNDILVGKPYQIVGNPFGSTTPTAARFVDISPWENTFTALYFDQFLLGDNSAGVSMKREYRMLDRFLNFNWGAIGKLATVTTTWQSCFSRDALSWNVGNSALLQQLQAQMLAQNADGLMLRFSTYLTVYDGNGVFNAFPPIKTRERTQENLEKLEKMYQMALDNVADIFYNPAYSRTAGTIGLWFKNEFPTAPAGKRLVPSSVPVMHAPVNDAPITLGVLAAQLNGNVLSLDASNTFPFQMANADSPPPIPVAERFDNGSFDIGVVSAGNFHKMAQIDYAQYNQAAFDQRSGLIDLPLTAEQAALFDQGPLQVRKTGADEVFLKQQEWTAEVVESGSFVDVGETRTLSIMVQNNGHAAPAGQTFWVAQYGNPFMLGNSDYYLCFDNDADFTLYNSYENPSDNSTVTHKFKDGNLLGDTSSSVVGGRQSKVTVATTNDADCTPVSYQTVRNSMVGVSLAPAIDFPDGIPQTGQLLDGATINYKICQVTTDAQGIATVRVTGLAGGFPSLIFFQNQSDIAFYIKQVDVWVDFVAPIRVLPNNATLMQDFVNAWNACYQQADARHVIWNSFIYPRILAPFYYMYPIMNKFMPLNDLERIEGAIDQLIVLISAEYREESTLAMPITRDLPPSSRDVLTYWATKLVKLNYPPMPLSLQ